MLNDIVITADSTCDLSDELIKKHNIFITPLYINKDDGSFKDGIEISTDDIYDYFNKFGKVTKTAAVPINDYIEYFKPLVDDNKTIIHINISDGLSSSYQNALIAAQELGNVYVVNSKNLSTGSGHIVLIAAELAEQGFCADDIVQKLNEIVPKVEASFVIDTLTYLHKGGRCSSVAALGANLLKLKPCIEVSDGLMHVGKKYRGSLAKCIEEYVSNRLENRTDIDHKRIFITHTGCSKEIIEKVKQLILSYGPFEQVIETIAGCTITSHCGPGTLGILFIRK